MPSLFSPRAFTHFGPSQFGPAGEIPALSAVRAGRPSGLRAGVRLDAPRWPGVYGMVNGRGELIYVGKAKSLRTRLLSYFRPASREPKAGDIIAETRLLVWEVAATELSALLRELELISRWQPRFNVQGQPRRKRQTFICLGRRPAPFGFVSSRRTASVAAAYGPVPAGKQAREAVRRVNDWYQLRDCPHPQRMKFRDQQDLFPLVEAAGCLRHEIGTCLGPCAAACSHAEYETQFQAALAFLEGNDPRPLAQLQQEMAQASVAQQFERAAALRDRLEPLLWLQQWLERLRGARSRDAVLSLTSYTGAEWWYVVRHGQVRAVLPAPLDAASALSMDCLLEQHFGHKSVAVSEQVEFLLLVDAWCRKHATQQTLLTPQEARQRCLLLAPTTAKLGSSFPA